MRAPIPAAVAGVVVAALGAAGLVRAAFPISGAAGGPPIVISGAFVRAPAPPVEEAAAYFTVHNETGTPDRLLAVSTDVARESMLHTDVNGRMVMLAGATVPAHGELVLTAGHDHVMIEHPERPIAAGQTVRLTLTFQHAGTVQVRAQVIAPGAAVPTTSDSPDSGD